MAIEVTTTERQLLRAGLMEKFGGLQRFTAIDFILAIILGELSGADEMKTLLSEKLTELQGEKAKFDQAKTTQEAALDMAITDTVSVIGKLDVKVVPDGVEPLPIAPEAIV